VRNGHYACTCYHPLFVFRSGCPMRWRPSVPRVWLAGRREKREYSRLFGSHLGNAGPMASQLIRDFRQTDSNRIPDGSR